MCSQYGPLRNSSQRGRPIAVSVANSCLRVAATQKFSKSPSAVHPRNIGRQATEDSIASELKGLAGVYQHQRSPMGSAVELASNTALLGKVRLEVIGSVMLHFMYEVCQLHRRGTRTTARMLVRTRRPQPKQSPQCHFLSDLTHDGRKADGSI
ncbi:telomerase reverse transcriptase/ribonuclease HI [Trypanosoma cruzi]|nr:telomerase reverse transcriptase/ribonuclease HI [Trypanosoma cruzi]